MTPLELRAIVTHHKKVFPREFDTEEFSRIVEKLKDEGFIDRSNNRPTPKLNRYVRALLAVEPPEDPTFSVRVVSRTPGLQPGMLTTATYTDITKIEIDPVTEHLFVTTDCGATPIISENVTKVEIIK